MSEPGVSKLKFYSLGLVAINKLLTSNTIEVTPVEDFPMVNGEITDNIEKYKSSSVDNLGSVKNVEVQTTVSIKATWLPINNSNRKTSPDVRRGETVVLYQFADSDKYYWNTLFDDNKLRRLETVVYAFSNNSQEDIADTANSTYYLEVSTHRKLIHVHTSKNDNEPYSYDVQINAKEGVITITDDIGNSFVLNSAERRLTMQNTDGSIIDVNKQIINIMAPEHVRIQSRNVSILTSKTIKIQTPNISIISSESTNITSSGSTNIKSSGDFSIEAPNTANIKSPNLNIN